METIESGAVKVTIDGETATGQKVSHHAEVVVSGHYDDAPAASLAWTLLERFGYKHNVVISVTRYSVEAAGEDHRFIFE